MKSPYIYCIARLHGLVNVLLVVVYFFRYRGVSISRCCNRKLIFSTDYTILLLVPYLKTIRCRSGVRASGFVVNISVTCEQISLIIFGSTSDRRLFALSSMQYCTIHVGLLAATILMKLI